MTEAKIAFNNRLWKPQDLSWNPHIAQHALMETSLYSLLYGMATTSKVRIFHDDDVTAVPLDTLREFALSLSLGVYTINAPHDNPCTRLICNCKIV